MGVNSISRYTRLLIQYIKHDQTSSSITIIFMSEKKKKKKKELCWLSCTLFPVKHSGLHQINITVKLTSQGATCI